MEDNELLEYKQFDEELKALMAKYNIQIDVAIDFPQYKILPEEVKFALYLFNKYGGVLKPKYTKVKK